MQIYSKIREGAKKEWCKIRAQKIALAKVPYLPIFALKNSYGIADLRDLPRFLLKFRFENKDDKDP